MKSHLLFVEGLMSEVSRSELNPITHIETIVINEKYFREILTTLQKIKSDIVLPLNNIGIIFRQTESLSFDELLEDIATGG